MAKVGVRELKSKLSHYLSLAKKGERVTVTERGQPIAVIGPVDESGLERRMMELVRGGVVSWSGGKPTGPHEPLVLKGKPLSQIILEDRE